MSIESNETSGAKESTGSRETKDSQAPKETREIPLFPLGTVLFPGGVLPLRIFEPRYVDMISRCMREGAGFGVVLIRQGAEARLDREVAQPDIFDTGTLARIVDFNQADNGLLGIVARGDSKFVVHNTWEQSDHLLLGEVEMLPEEPVGELLEEHASLVEVLQQLTAHPLVQKLKVVCS